MLGVDLQQRARDRVADRAELAGFPAARDLHHRVESPRGVGHGERLDRGFGVAIAPEVLLERLAVDDDRALTGDEAHAGDARLAASGALAVRRDLLLVLPAGCRGGLGREAAESRPIRADDGPVPLDLVALAALRAIRRGRHLVLASFFHSRRRSGSPDRVRAPARSALPARDP